MKYLQHLLRSTPVALLALTGLQALGQRPTARINAPVVDTVRTTLSGSRPPRAAVADDLGLLPGDTAIKGMTLVFNRSAAQEAAIQTLLAAQSNPASPQYHQWLTPDQFATRFGVADADLSKAAAWLAAEGFTAIAVSPNRDRIDFSGTAAQAKQAFGAELHQYRDSVDPSRTNFAPATDLSLPSALAPVVMAVDHLSTFRPRPQIRPSPVRPQFTSNVSGNHFLTPGDIATQYDVTPVLNSGITGAGQSIAIAGQSYIETSDIQHFQTASGLPSKPPTLFLVPGTGASALYQGDESESDLDVEWSSGLGRGAQVIFVYVGSSPNYGVFDAVTYAVNHNLAPIISLSYSGCEAGFTVATLQQYSNMAEQANTQGQTIITASGDSGSTACFGQSGFTLAQQQALNVNALADLPGITAVGGTQMQAGTFTAGNNTYFAAATTGSDNISSLLSYVPETVWNEDVAGATTLSSGGGGSSAVIARPSWQTGVPGITAGNYRLVPDISLQASTGSPGFLFCTSDTSAWGTGQTGSCTNGFRDAGSLLTVAGGTSFSAPIFAGMLAVLNQAKHATGQGNINPILYGLAGNAATYASAFHDITTGTNACDVADTNLCSAAGASGYPAGVGYDDATGLGSIDFTNLVAAWPSTTASALNPTTTTLTAATTTPTAGASDLITIVVNSSAAGTPTGTVAVSVDGAATTSLPLTKGQASYTYPGSTVGGSHLVAVTYSGDATFAPSVASVTLDLANTILPTGSFSLVASPVTVAQGSTSSGLVTLTPSGGYAGSVNFAITTTLPANTCYSVEPSNPTTTPIPNYTLTFGSGAAVCATFSTRSGTGNVHIGKGVAQGSTPTSPWREEKRGGVLLAGLFGLGLLTRRRVRRLPTLLALAGLGFAMTVGLSGCGSSSTPVTPPTTTTTSGTYQLTLVGTDSVTSSITSSTTVTLTVN